MTRTIGTLLILVWLITPVSAQDDKMADAVKGLVKKMMDASAEGNYRVVLDMTHPKVLEQMGGKEKAIEEVEKAMKIIKAQGFVFKLKDITTPTIAKSGQEHYSVTAFTMVVTGLGKKTTIKSALIGVSSDAGTSWKFINLDKEGEKGVRTLLPDLPASMVIPKQEQKVEDNG